VGHVTLERGWAHPVVPTWRLGSCLKRTHGAWVMPHRCAQVALGLFAWGWAHPNANVVLGSCLCATPTWHLGCLPGGLAHPSAHVALKHAKI